VPIAARGEVQIATGASRSIIGGLADGKARFVIPAKAGIHEHGLWKPGSTVFMDPGLRRDDGRGTRNMIARDKRQTSSG
jgi:hypothetical protein